MIDINFLTYELLKKINSENIRINEPMSKHTSFKIGGAAEIFVTPSSEDEILWAVKTAKSVSSPYFVLGNGSNLLVNDNGYSGIIINIGNNFSNINVSGSEITAQSGALLSKIANIAAKNNLTGFEFASGIPGSLGGAVVMNAGAYGGEMKDVVVSTRYIDKDLCVKTITGDAHCFGYRQSAFKGGEIILESTMRLKSASYELIKERMAELNNRRKDKQPLEYPSAGSTFKRPEGYFAAKLIDDAGLRGVKCGGAMVSEKHCGFVINYNNATYDDVINVIEKVKSEVYDKFGVKLECEVKIL